MRWRLVIACGLILSTATGCVQSIAPALDPFCVIGPPPPELIPAEGEPAGWVDDFLATYESVCR